MMRKGERKFGQRRQSTQFNNKKTHNLPPLENRGSAMPRGGAPYKASPRGMVNDNNGQPPLRGIMENGPRQGANPRGAAAGSKAPRGGGYDGPALQAQPDSWHNNLESWMSAKPPREQPIVTPPEPISIADPGAPPEPTEKEREADREARRRRRAERRAKGGHKDSPQATPRDRKPAKKEEGGAEPADWTQIPVMPRPGVDPRLAAAGGTGERPGQEAGGRPGPSLEGRARMARPDGATDSRPPAYGL